MKNRNYEDFIKALSESDFLLAKDIFSNGKVDVNRTIEDGDYFLLYPLIVNAKNAIFLINEIGADPLVKNKKGKTLLNILATVGNVNEIKQIVESIKTTNSLETSEAVGFILGVDIPDHQGNTPLINAVIKEEFLTIKYLFEKLGANPELRNNDGENVFTLVQKEKTKDIIRSYIDSIIPEGMSYGNQKDIPSSSCKIDKISKISSRHIQTNPGNDL